MCRPTFIALVALGLWLGTPRTADAASVAGWALSATPTTLTSGVTTEVRLRLTDTDGSGDIGCLRMSVPAAFAVSSVGVIATSADTPWTATRTGTGPTAIRVYNPDGGGKLNGGDWVDFRISVRAAQTGNYSWQGEVDQSNDCSGATFLEPISLTMTVVPQAATPVPTPPPATPSPSPSPVTTVPSPPAPAPTTSPRAASPSATPASAASPQPSGPTPTAASSPGPSAPGASAAESDAPIPPASPIAGAGPGEEGGERGRGDPAADDPVSGAASRATDGGRVLMVDDTSAADADLAIGFEALGLLGAVYSWFVPGLVVGVPGLLLVFIVIAHVTLGAVWLPNVGRFLGPAPPHQAPDEHLWWATGRPGVA